ncbi:MAG: hypothetical protein LBD77_07000 [Bifidobacteriaceae bacterium]|nr:hypothetical protein [Bifidobacteriaceae bacterium]
MSGVETGPETWHAIDLAVTSLAADWQDPIGADRRELWLLACLRATIDERITALIAAIPASQRNWDQILNALGHSMAAPDLDRRRADIEDDVASYLARFEDPEEGDDTLPDGQPF